MIGTVMAVRAAQIGLAFVLLTGFPDLDKTGTSGVPNETGDLELIARKDFMTACSFGAERAGFEPAVRFPVRRFSRPMRSTTLPPLRAGESYMSDPIPTRR